MVRWWTIFIFFWCTLGWADSSRNIHIIHQLIERYSYDRIKNPREIAIIIDKYASRYKIDPLLVMAVIHEESHFRTRAVSSKGALGLMQVMPETGREIASNLNIRNFSHQRIFEPPLNIRMGIWYLMFLKKKFNNNRSLYLTAYNIGPTRLREFHKNRRPLDYRYAKKVLRTYRRFQNFRSRGLTAQVEPSG